MRRPLAALALAALTALYLVWIGEGAVLLNARRNWTEVMGIGVYLPAADLVVAGLWLLTGADVALRRGIRVLTAAALWLTVAWGIAGLLSPGWQLGGASLAEVSAGGHAGDALASPLGGVVLAAAALAGSLLVAPRRTVIGLARTGHGAGIAAVALWRHFLRPSAARARSYILFPRLPGRTSSDPWEQTAATPVVAGSAALGDLALAMETAPSSSATAGTTAVTAAVIDTTGAEASGAGGGPTPAQDSLTFAEDPKPPAGRASKPKPSQRHSADGWQMPPLSILKPDPPPARRNDSKRQAGIIVETLASFGVDSSITQINVGPAVTQFGIEPGWDVKTRQIAERDKDGHTLLDKQGRTVVREEEISRTRVRVNRITRLTNDIALALAAPSIRVEAPAPGKPMIGVEVPNPETRIVSLRGVIDSAEFRRALQKYSLPVALGRNVSGTPMVVDLAAMPHLLIAGATGAGKSVAINSIIVGLLTHFSPEQLRLILVDPKRVELTTYGKIPHLAFSHVVTEPDEAVAVLQVTIQEMERRYRRFQANGARNIQAYNAKERPEGPLPYWVVILDELADLMMSAPVEVEQQLVRLAQLARATGIHLVIATQRPSVDVVTGLIKANFPTRIAFATTSQTDSRVVIDRAGAEKLLGRGDMLFMSTENFAPQRVQGTFVSDEEIQALIDFWAQDRFKRMPRPTLDHLLAEAAHDATANHPQSDPGGAESGERDTLYDQAVALAQDHTRISTSLLQRRLRIGYPRAARLIDTLEAEGVIGGSDGGQSRPVRAAAEPAETG